MKIIHSVVNGRFFAGLIKFFKPNRFFIFFSIFLNNNQNAEKFSKLK
jgi:hypothetical protein